MLKTVGNPSTRYGDQTIIDGNLVIGTAGKGIDFSATPGSGTGEVLDDYEEGTWTPIYVPETNSFTSVSYDSVAAWYRKIGSVVFCSARLRTSALDVGSASGAVYLGGLPFAAINNTARQSYFPVAIGTNFVTTQPSGIRVDCLGGTLAVIQTGYNNGTLSVSNLNTVAARNFMAVSFSYITND
jgi:hypothetical protein